MPSPRRSFFMIPITLVEIVEDIRKKCAVKTRMRNKKNYSDGHLYHCLDARVAAEEDVAGFGFSTEGTIQPGADLVDARDAAPLVDQR